MRLVWICVFALSFGFPAAAQERVSHGFFHDIALTRPAQPATHTVLLLGTGHDAATASALAREGALVASIDVKHLQAAFAKDAGVCAFPDGDLENLSHWLQGYARLPDYRPPVLVGQGDGAAIGYAMAAQADRGVFAGVITRGALPPLALGKPPCKGAGTLFNASTPVQKTVALQAVQTLATPWLALGDVRELPELQAFVAAINGAAVRAHGHEVPPLVAAVRAFATASARTQLAPPPADVRDLPLVEVPTTGTAQPVFAVLLSGDGGWAGLDAEVAAALAARGIPVVGFDSLRYFWSARTPDGLARDLDRVVRAYAMRWQRPRVLLIGYSQGADVLPFAVNRLPISTRATVAHTVLMGLGKRASFEFHLGNWLSAGDDDALEIAPEVLRLSADRTLCIEGEGDSDATCASLPPGHVTVRTLPGGHHFGGDYARLADLIGEGVRASAAEESTR
ncbi:AcvB/VirJ family lysyl-phosphatidylglycerol hydrolase [Luteimonas terrae]|uniref:Type IV secretory pathway VirJ component n=1 Tax=Luteimonas terrae TaxID=1530191 RepID=A0ABU1XW83_9GAMM|nr:AcvB/VirJ family lysyl-phosphatidylglycerol hydrolase [Luteimonas terrae]MDR7193023.1 type IV secretory pathway VirJ component [Luteimonas terrae]